MKRQFGHIAMIDVLSICVLTLLILSMSDRDEAEPSNGVDKLFASNVMTVRVDCNFPKVIDDVPEVGLEVVLANRPYATANPRSKVLDIRRIGSSVFATFIPPPYPTRDDYLHVYVKDRGSLRLQEFTLSLHVENHPMVQSADIDPFPADALSWRIPLYVPNGDKKLRLIASRSEDR